MTTPSPIAPMKETASAGQQIASLISRAGSRQELNVFGLKVYIAAGGAETAGGASVVFACCPPGTGAPLHRHEISETFMVSRGELTLIMGDSEYTLTAGDIAQVAPWVPHAFNNRTTTDVELFLVGRESGHELFFMDADELARSGNFNPETAAALCEKHDIELIR